MHELFTLIHSPQRCRSDDACFPRFSRLSTPRERGAQAHASEELEGHDAEPSDPPVGESCLRTRMTQGHALAQSTTPVRSASQIDMKATHEQTTIAPLVSCMTLAGGCRHHLRHANRRSQLTDLKLPAAVGIRMTHPGEVGQVSFLHDLWKEMGGANSAKEWAHGLPRSVTEKGVFAELKQRIQCQNSDSVVLRYIRRRPIAARSPPENRRRRFLCLTLTRHPVFGCASPQLGSPPDFRAGC
jgi:hypothetical protein